MDNFINKLKEVVSPQMILYMVIALLAIIILSMIIRHVRVKKIREELDKYENKYAELKGIPLSFKLNKATALSKVNKSLSESISEYQNKYDNAQELLKEFSALLAELDDYVYSKKVKKSNHKIEEIKPIVSECEKVIKEVDALFDEILEQENMQRSNINVLKNNFREFKKMLMNNRGAYRQSVETLDEKIVQIENMFSIFEEWMFASEFNKASDKQEEIRNAMGELKEFLDVLPGLYEKATIVIPNREEQIALLYTQAMHRGVYLQHLDVKKNLEVISDIVSDILSRLCECNLDNVETMLNDCEVRLQQLENSIAKEESSFDTVNEKIQGLFSRIKGLNINVQQIKEVYSRVNERFGFENLSGRLKEMDAKMDVLNEQRVNLENVLGYDGVPYSTLLITYDEVAQECGKLEVEAKELKAKLDNATSDEQRAKKQLIKLQLLVNEMKNKIMKYRLPSIDEKFESDIRDAQVYIVDIRQYLDETPLNVEALNKKLDEAIDYIYTLFNSVNNLVGMADMVENAILFGNKYRSEYPEIDSELTRAELCFTNGQYTKSLKIAIAAIERLHPGAYEKLIAQDGEKEVA